MVKTRLREKRRARQTEWGKTRGVVHSIKRLRVRFSAGYGSPVVVQDFAAVGNAHCGTFPKIQGGHCPLSIVMPIHGGKGPRKVGQVPS